MNFLASDRSNPNQFYKSLTRIRKQWSCVNDNCEETTTKCLNANCETVKNQFKASNYQPEAPRIEKPPVEFINVPEIFNFSQFPVFNTASSIFDNLGMIDLVSNPKNFAYYWSNSMHISRKCLDNTCTTKTKTCTNGKCEEKIDTKPI